MIKTIEKTGRTEEDAVAAALVELGKARSEVKVEVLEKGRAGFFGIGAVPAKVRVSFEEPDAAPAFAPAEKPAPQKPQPEEKKPQSAEKRIPDDEKTAKLAAFLKGLFERMNVEAEAVITTGEAENTLTVELRGAKVGALIGRRGETLDAIQHLANYVVNSGDSDRIRINIDAENYRAKRADALSGLARKTAAKVVKYRRNMTLEPMNAYERHVIHTALQDFEGVTTYSTGTEPNRRVVIAYDRPAGETYERPARPAGNREGRRRSDDRRQKPRRDAEVTEPVYTPAPVRENTTREWH
ncbi:MAG: RNA-binding cell elongation regulator Jag/EloR [bacterium]